MTCVFCQSAKKHMSNGASSSVRDHTARLLVDGLRAGALAVGPDGHVCDANPGAANLLRVPLDALLHANIADVLSPVAQLAESARRNERIEVSLRLRDGTSAMMGCSATEVRGPEGHGWVVLFQEISAIADLRRQRDRLLQLATVGEALPSVLHEIRNPLAAVTSMLEVLVEEAPEGELQRDLHAVLFEIRRMSLCLQGLGGLQRELQSETHEPVDVSMREACRILGNSASARGVNISCGVRDMPLLPLRGAVVRGIVFNLLRNAIDACGSDGDVAVEAWFDGDARRVFLEIRDTGCGMTQEEVARCCDLFFTTKEHGSGVGLPICKQAIERSGGTMSIQSRHGAGTHVHIEIPISSPSKGKEHHVSI